MIRLNICIATYKRNDGLRNLLESVQAMQPLSASDIAITILVIDNNPDKCARVVIEAFQTDAYPIPVAYHHEARPGVSHVRNTALALSQDARFAVFVDDDETVSPEWLDILWQEYQKTKPAAVFGPSIAVYPENTPDWMLKGDFHSDHIASDGLRDLPGSVANVLIDLDVIRAHNLKFETSISEIGGEDTLLFTQMLDLGERLANARDAIVHDHVPPDRVTSRWLLKRWRRTGWTDAMVNHRHRSPRFARMLSFFAGLLRIVAGGILTGLWFIIGGFKMTQTVAKGLYTLQRGLGMIDFARGNQILEYGRPIEA